MSVLKWYCDDEYQCIGRVYIRIKFNLVMGGSEILNEKQECSGFDLIMKFMKPESSYGALKTWIRKNLPLKVIVEVGIVHTKFYRVIIYRYAPDRTEQFSTQVDTVEYGQTRYISCYFNVESSLLLHHQEDWIFFQIHVFSCSASSRRFASRSY